MSESHGTLEMTVFSSLRHEFEPGKVWIRKATILVYSRDSC